jgi:hypothetical protein
MAPSPSLKQENERKQAERIRPDQSALRDRIVAANKVGRGPSEHPDVAPIRPARSSTGHRSGWSIVLIVRAASGYRQSP